MRSIGTQLEARKDDGSHIWCVYTVQSAFRKREIEREVEPQI